MSREQENYKTEYEIIDLIRLRLYQRIHGLAVVLGGMEIRVEDQDGEFSTDGLVLFLDAERLRREFRKGSRVLCLEFLHMLSHCLLGHIFRSAGTERGKIQDSEYDREAWELALRLWGEPGEPVDIRKLQGDSHVRWEKAAYLRRLVRASGDLGTGTGIGGEWTENWWRAQKALLTEEKPASGQKRRAGTARKRRTQHFVPEAGYRGDYREILKSFSSFREDSRVNPEEFQYAWYAYGMEHYGNMPLLEPLEYREERKIEDLVLAIDTSASCEKELVRIFLEETRGILDQEELFFRRFCLHIIQCDNRIQRDDRIRSREEFDRYLEKLQITGGGGTDFTAAFRRIDELAAAGEFRDLKGVLYFTDGCGLYPSKAPGYEVYFVMVKGKYDTIDMPDWIHCLVLEDTKNR